MAGKIRPRIYKGTRDFLPQQMIRRNYVLRIIQSIFEKYGFDPLETPAMELWETLSGKYGEEGDRLTYRFIDRGDREVGLRYDLTVPLSRVVAMYPQELPKPFKRYQIQPVWRADKPQKGRFREFYQCDIDIVGSDSMLAEAEIIAILNEILTTLGFRKYSIRINNRKILSGIAQTCGVKGELEFALYRAIDKLDKIGMAGVEEELRKSGISAQAIARLQQILEIGGSNEDRLKICEQAISGSAAGAEGLKELRELFTYLQSYAVPEENYLFDVKLARGLDYYTGPIYETVVEEPRIGSITGGGRYDKLIGMFSGQEQPATGSSVGFERIITVMEEMHMFPDEVHTTAQVLVTVFDSASLPYSIRIARLLRAAGINTDLYTGKSKLRGQFGLANDRKIPMVVIAGPDEQVNAKANLKDMRSGEQQQLKLEALPEAIRAAMAK